MALWAAQGGSPGLAAALSPAGSPNPVVALAVVVSGVALGLSTARRAGPRLAGHGLALAVVGLGLAGLSQDVWAPLLAPGDSGSRMPPLTALGLAAIGAAILARACRAWTLFASLTLMVGAGAYVALLGWLYGVELLYSAGLGRPVAPVTALALGALAVGTLWLEPGRGALAVVSTPLPERRLARRTLLAAILAPPLVAGLLLWARVGAGLADPQALALGVAASGLFLLGLAWWNSHELLASQASRSRSEQALVRSEERFAKAFRASPAAITISNLAEGRYLDVNQAFLELVGREAAEVVGRTAFEIGFWVDPGQRADMVERLRRDGAVHEQEVRIRRSTGELLSVLLSAERVEVGGEACVLALSYDITRLKQAEQALIESEARLRKAQEVAQLGSWILASPVAPEAPFECDRLTSRILGVEPHAAPQTREQFLAFVHPEDRDRVEAAIREALLDQPGYGLAHRLLRPDGAVRWVREEAEIVRGAAGAPLRVVGTLQDETRHHQLELQLLQAQKMEAVGRLAGGIAHDFNNLLSVILGYGHVLSERLDDPDLQRRVGEILRAAERAAGLTRQLLAFSRRQVLAAELLDLREVVRGLSEMLRRLIGEDVELVTRLPEACGKVRADRGQLEQVLMNLAVNARDAMPQGGRLSMEVSDVELDGSYVQEEAVMAPGAYLLLAVSDTGAGMDAETRSHIFEPFFTTKPEGQGTGLGLATVYGIVKQSGGFIWADSEPGRGATFKIYLPRVDAAARPVAGNVPPQAAARGQGTILLAEDEPALRELTREVLEDAGYRVLEAGHPAGLLELARGHAGDVQLLLTDVVMPGMSGRALAEALRALRPRLKVLFMSGYTDDQVVRHGVFSEGTAFLQKPFTPDALLAAVRAALAEPPLPPRGWADGL